MSQKRAEKLARRERRRKQARGKRGKGKYASEGATPLERMQKGILGGKVRRHDD